MGTAKSRLSSLKRLFVETLAGWRCSLRDPRAYLLTGVLVARVYCLNEFSGSGWQLL